MACLPRMRSRRPRSQPDGRRAEWHLCGVFREVLLEWLDVWVRDDKHKRCGRHGARCEQLQGRVGVGGASVVGAFCCDDVK